MIKNATNNTILCNKEKVLRSHISKAIGLMFSKKQEIGLVFVFEKLRKVDLHMFFVFYSIDVIFLDEEKRIIEMKKSFMPFTFYFSNKKAKYVIELPQYSLSKSNTKISDLVEF